MAVARIRIQIAADGSLAEAIAAPGAACPLDELRRTVTTAGVVAGVDEAALQQFSQRLADPGFEGTFAIARGTAAAHGDDGRVECGLDTRLVPGQEHADGHIDFRERGRLQPIAVDQVLGHVVPPTAGTVGTDVRGRRLEPRPGRAHTVRFGQGVRLDEGRLVATRGGVLLRDERQLDVVPLHSHGGDVDYKSGNLHTEGSLEIRGDVRAGFTATAGGDVTVTGTVEGGSVTAGGSVQVSQAVLGTDAVVRAGASIGCRHATSARLVAGEAVDVGDHLTRCVVRGARIRLQHGRGAVVGGELRARHSIQCLGAGVDGGATTLLAVADVTAEQAELVRRAGPDSKAGRMAVRGQRDGGRADGKARRAAVRSTDALQDEKLRLLQAQRELLQSASVEIAGTAHAGVRIRFGTVTRQIDEPRTGIRFRWDPDRNDIHEEPMP